MSDSPEVRVAGAEPIVAGACRVIAEAGANHNNSVDRAIEMAQKAADGSLLLLISDAARGRGDDGSYGQGADAFVQTSCVDLDYRARNTIGNAIETRRWAESNGFDTIIVVSSNYHMPRTLVELDHALPNLQKIPYPVAATIDPHDWWHNPAVARMIFTEYLKFLAVWVRTYLEDDPERSSVAHLISGGSPIKAQVIAEPLWR